MFQKEQQGVEQPFTSLATAFYKLYQDRVELFKTIA